ncbi:MAG: hypothetical protein KAZ38_21645 [Caldilineaceae bacterium]|nr:hypothetical protein [Caldilineaceae bacterium]
MRLKLALLGSFQGFFQGTPSAGKAPDASPDPIPFPTERSRLLLAYLASHPDVEHSRELLAIQFWPDTEAAQARKNLRTELNRLRSAIQDGESHSPFILASRHNLSVDPRQAVIDTQQFDNLIDANRKHMHDAVERCPACLERMRQAIDLYRGPFLESVVSIDSPDLESWLTTNRRHYQGLVVQFVGHLHHNFEREGDLAQAQAYAQHQLTLEAWNEDAHRALMRIFLRQGQRAAAMHQYENCRRIMAEALDAEPSEETQTLYQRIRAQEVIPTTKDMTSPYVGLRAFTSADANNFFGRVKIIQRLHESIQTHDLMAVLGPSGSGKSSVIHAGLLPRLAGRAAPKGKNSAIQWTPISFRPGDTPFRNLALALAPHCNMQPAALVPELRAGTRKLTDLVDEITAPAPASSPPPTSSDHPAPERRLLLVIDQFEELFSLCSDAEIRQAFLDLILQPSLDAGRGPKTGRALTILVTVRADFMGYLLSQGTMADLLQDATTILGPMQPDEMRQVIEQPAWQKGVMFEPGLVLRLLADVGSAPGSLPLLEFALSQLWANRQDGWITHAAYEKNGGVAGALTKYANGIYANLSPQEQVRTRYIFPQLIQPGQGTADTRRLATRAEIGENDWPLVHKLADARLVVTGRNTEGNETVEVIHEALILEWDLLRQWIEIDRTFRVWQQRLRILLAEWRLAGRDESALLRGGFLTDSEEWLARQGESFSAHERGFITASVQHRDDESAAIEARRQSTLVTAQSLARHEAQSSRRLRRLVIGLVGLAFVLIATAFYTWQLQGQAQLHAVQAEESAHLALARQLSAQSLQAMDTLVDRGVLLSLESLARTPDPTDITSLLTGLKLDPMLITFLHGHSNETGLVAFSQDGTALFSGDVQGTAFVWSMQDPTAPGRPISITNAVSPTATALLPATGILTLQPTTQRLVYRTERGFGLWDLEKAVTLVQHDVPNKMRVVTFSGDGSRLVVDDSTEELWVYDALTGALLTGPQLHPPRTTLCAVNGDASRLALKGSDGSEATLSIWDTTAQETLAPPQGGHIDDIQACTFSPDNNRLATAGFDGTVRLWDAATGLQMGSPRTGHQGRVLAVAFSPDGTRMVSGDTANQIILWETESGAKLGLPLVGHENWIRSLVFSPDGRMLASGDASGKIALWDMAARQILNGHTARVRSVALSPDESTLLTSSFDGHLVLWDARTGEKLRDIETAHPNSIIQVGYSPDGRTLASLDAGGFVILWETQTWTPRFDPMPAHQTVLIGLAFTPDSKWMATGDFSGQIRLWDVAAGEAVGEPIQAHKDEWALSLAFSPDGTLLASGSTDSTIRLWSLPDLAPVGEPLIGHTNWVNVLLFEPDGKTLISGSNDQTIRRWDVATGQPLGEAIEGDRSQIWGLTLLEKESGPVLVSLGSTGNVQWWDWRTQLPLGPALRTAIETESMAITRSGDRFYLGTFDGTAQMWQVAALPWPQRACLLANRNLSAEEWRTFLRGIPYAATCP